MNNNGLDQKSIEELAYQFWQERGSPEGSPEEDWLRAEQELNSKGASAEVPLRALAADAAGE